MPFHKVIGIDLGTTYSAVSIWDGKEVRVIESAFGLNTVPSVVGLDPDGGVIVGTPAQNNLVSDPTNTVIEVKREMGTYQVEPAGPGDPGVPKRIPFRGRDYLPQEISAFILMELKRQAENIVGEPIHDAIITVPAYFKDPQRGATEDAAQMARMNVRMLLNEPTAAAVCFGADKLEDEQTHTYVVYDLGGGTFDVSIVQVSPGNVSVVGTGGDPRLGGGDFDDRITGYVLQRIREEHGVDLTGDPAVWQRIKREAEMRKRELSVANMATLNLPFLTPTLSVNIPLARATFDSLISDLLQNSLDCLDEAIESAHQSNGIERDEIEQVLLVGGSTKIACIRAMLADHLGLEPKDIRADIKPDEVVARGAGMVAREYAPSESFGGAERLIDLSQDAPAASEGALVLQDVTSHTLGVLANRADMVAILLKDSRIPGEITKDNFVNGGGAKEIDILIFQGEHPVAFENDLIGTLPIVLPEAKEQGYYHFAVTFSLDVHGLLKVAVKCLNDNQIWQTELQCNVRATKEQIEASSKHLSEVMASGSDGATPAGADPPAPPSGLPKPPGRLPKPPGRAGTAEAQPLPPPPLEVPDEFKSTARRVYRLVPQLTPPGRERLTEKYKAFVAAVQDDSPDVEELGDELYDLYRELRG
ncbi:MAG: Hsp70 family protein [Actinobacteria bacterium]|nr:Hsp70 family protein [Actinomycetota bacterium]